MTASQQMSISVKGSLERYRVPGKLSDVPESRVDGRESLTFSHEELRHRNSIRDVLNLRLVNKQEEDKQRS